MFDGHGNSILDKLESRSVWIQQFCMQTITLLFGFIQNIISLIYLVESIQRTFGGVLLSRDIACSWETPRREVPFTYNGLLRVVQTQ